MIDVITLLRKTWDKMPSIGIYTNWEMRFRGYAA